LHRPQIALHHISLGAQLFQRTRDTVLQNGAQSANGIFARHPPAVRDPRDSLHRMQLQRAPGGL
jgi:hypothetical protein